jgi:uncharacterized protein
MPTIDEARDWYDANDPVHGLGHILRVLALAERMGEELGADLEVLQAAALLHDASGAHPGEGADRQSHEQTSALFAGEVLKKEGWEQTRIDAVQHCIRAHRFRGNESPETLEAKILFDADKLDVMGAFGAYHEYLFKLCKVKDQLHTEPARRLAEERQAVLTAFFNQLAVEARVVS